MERGLWSIGRYAVVVSFGSLGENFARMVEVGQLAGNTTGVFIIGPGEENEGMINIQVRSNAEKVAARLEELLNLNSPVVAPSSVDPTPDPADCVCHADGVGPKEMDSMSGFPGPTMPDAFMKQMLGALGIRVGYDIAEVEGLEVDMDRGTLRVRELSIKGATCTFGS